MDDIERMSLTHERLGSLPVVNWFLARLRLAEILGRYLSVDDARLRLAPATVVALLVRNIILSHEPLYALNEWATPYEPSLLDFEAGDLAALNDERVGRTLDRLFDADRASLFRARRGYDQRVPPRRVAPAQRLDQRLVSRGLRERDGS